MKEEKLKEYYSIYTDAWKLFKRFSYPDETAAFWGKYTAEVGMLDKKYGHSELFRNLAVAVTKELQRIEKIGDKMTIRRDD